MIIRRWLRLGKYKNQFVERIVAFERTEPPFCLTNSAGSSIYFWSNLLFIKLNRTTFFPERSLLLMNSQIGGAGL